MSDKGITALGVRMRFSTSVRATVYCVWSAPPAENAVCAIAIKCSPHLYAFRPGLHNAVSSGWIDYQRCVRVSRPTPSFLCHRRAAAALLCLPNPTLLYATGNGHMRLEQRLHVCIVEGHVAHERYEPTSARASHKRAINEP